MMLLKNTNTPSTTSPTPYIGIGDGTAPVEKLYSTRHDALSRHVNSLGRPDQSTWRESRRVLVRVPGKGMSKRYRPLQKGRASIIPLDAMPRVT